MTSKLMMATRLLARAALIAGSFPDDPDRARAAAGRRSREPICNVTISAPRT